MYLVLLTIIETIMHAGTCTVAADLANSVKTITNRVKPYILCGCLV